MNINVIRFNYNAHIEEWNTFIKFAKNSTFLFHRSFMDYHRERFTDFSLLIYDEKNNLKACFPANVTNDKEIISHQGLTYGGLIIDEKAKLLLILAIFKEILSYYYNLGFEILNFKQIPRFYNSVGSDEIDYAFFLLDAKLTRRDTALAIIQSNKLPIQNRRIRSIKKAKNNGVVVKKSKNFREFYDNILTPNLMNRFGVSPIHSLEELKLLANNFPDQIVLYSAYVKDKIMAGCILFVTDKVAHSQYISACSEGRKNGSLDYLFSELINFHFANKQIFDFGICNENEGTELNIGLLEWKEGFGGRTFSHDHYKIATRNFFKLVING